MERSMNSAIHDYKHQSSAIRKHMHDTHKAMTRLTNELAKHNAERMAQSFWDKVTTIFAHRKRINSIEESLLEQRHKSSRLDSEYERLKKQFLLSYLMSGLIGSTHAEQITQLKKVFNAADALRESASETLNMAKKALSEISDAESSVSSAQTFELFDMATSSKGVSLMSTISTSSASSDISDAASAVKRFTVALGKHQELAHSLTEPMTLEWIDFGFDMAGANLGFDFTSVLSYFALSSASSDLDHVAQQIKKTLPELQSQKSQCEAAASKLGHELKNIIKQASQSCLDSLLAAGIDVSESEFASVVTNMANHSDTTKAQK
jgi:uncharacterized protein YfiM (DUF2279 family)